MDATDVTRDMGFLDREFVAVIERHFHVRLRHDLQSVATLDALFHAGPLRQIAEDDFRNVAVMLAAYLGETVRALARGGTWKLDDALGPCIVDVPGVKGSVRVLARAEKRIRSDAKELLMPFVAQAIALKN
jgi:hypothetical protein